MFRIIIALSCPLAAAAASPRPPLPRVAILTTGGIIAGVAAAQNSVTYVSGKLDADQLLSAVPQLGDVAQLSSYRVSSIGSQDMTDLIWLDLARRIAGLASGGAVDGVVITHGTDTLEETAFFLDLVTSTQMPVVLVGAVRPSDAPGADGPANLYDAVRVAAGPESKGRGVLVVMNGEIHAASAVEKTDISSLDAFGSPTAQP